MADNLDRERVQALRTSDQLWSTVTDSAMVDHVGEALASGLENALSKIEEPERSDFIRSCCAGILSLVNLNFIGVESRYVIDAVEYTVLTPNPVAWLALRPFYPVFERICDDGLSDDPNDLRILESGIVVLGSEMVQRAQTSIAEPVPEGTEKDDVCDALEQARMRITNPKSSACYPHAMVGVQKVISWILRGGSLDIGEELPVPELDKNIPAPIMAAFQTTVEYVNSRLRSNRIRSMCVGGVWYGTYAADGGLLKKESPEENWKEVCAREETPTFRDANHFRRWLGQKLGVKGRRSNLKNWQD